jgi:uncharacterized membrane protein YhhN
MYKALQTAFFIIFLGQILGRILSTDLLDYIFKPLIMPCLAAMLWYIQSNTSSAQYITFRNRILVGFFFSWIGDLALMLEKFNPMLFLVGLSSFLIAHLFYIFAFYFSIKCSSHISILKRKPYLFLPLLLFGIGFFYFITPNLGNLTIPVAVYVSIICFMSCFALNREGLVNPKSFKLIFYGALWFMLSDSLIALNKFMLQVPYSGVWVMITYMIAQYLIMRGTVVSNESSLKIG